MQKARNGRYARIYDVARTAHLERLKSMTRGDFIYRKSSYDFDTELAREMNARQSSRWRTIIYLVRHRPEIVELNEPAYIAAWPSVFLYMGAVHILNTFSTKKMRVVAYAIENANIVDALQAKFRSRAVSELTARLAIRILSFSFSKVAFGSDGAREAYVSIFPKIESSTTAKLFDALPAARAGLNPVRNAVVLFVGSYEARKGILELLAAWDVLRNRRRDVELRLLGKGPLDRLVRKWSEGKAEVQFVVDPPRSSILTEYESARTVVLLSQPTRTWREQVGLPIVEGLSYGCEIVATTETGLAPWLQLAQHRLVSPDASAAVVADALAASVDRAMGPAARIAQLPAIDGRVAADEWLFSTEME
ncbi:hypothetical protein GQ85_05535 [Rhodococcus rhodochrous]|nr:hypothetical protein GQ85_05535 [Rhodococcus rhodochrous]